MPFNRRVPSIGRVPTRLLPIGVVSVMFFVLLTSGRSEKPATFEPVRAAAPQSAPVDWVERFPADGSALVFHVDTVRVETGGWEADIAIENHTDRRYEIPGPTASASRLFGLMVFANGDLDALDSLNRKGELPTVRTSKTATPELPPVLGPGETWSGTIAAAGSLPAERWLRVVFGPLKVKGDVPKGVDAEIVWITDHAHRLG